MVGYSEVDPKRASGKLIGSLLSALPCRADSSKGVAKMQQSR